jgi:hypothetical protein
MRTLILAEHTFNLLEQALSKTPLGRELLEGFASDVELPTDRELVALSRAKGPAPDAFVKAREHRDAGRQAAIDTRVALNDLILHAYDAGVSPRVLAGWVGLKETRIFEIVGAREETSGQI